MYVRPSTARVPLVAQRGCQTATVPLRPDDDAVRRARETARRLRDEAGVERALRDAARTGGTGGTGGTVRGGPAVPAGSRVRGRVVGGDLAGPLAALESAGWLLLHDVTRRLSRLTRLDHVAVGAQGVVVVQQVRFEGVVTVEDDVLRLNAAPYAVETGRVVAAATALRAVLDAGPGRGVLLRTVLCVVPAEPAAAAVRGPAHVVGRAGLVAAVAAGPAVLDAGAAAAVHASLADGLRTGDGLRRPAHP